MLISQERLNGSQKFKRIRNQRFFSYENDTSKTEIRYFFEKLIFITDWSKIESFEQKKRDNSATEIATELRFSNSNSALKTAPDRRFVQRNRPTFCVEDYKLPLKLEINNNKKRDNSATKRRIEKRSSDSFSARKTTLNRHLRWRIWWSFRKTNFSPIAESWCN